MNTSALTPLDPLISEFASQEEANAYDAWFKAKVQEALDSKEPGIAHDEVVRRMQEKFAALKSQQKVA